MTSSHLAYGDPEGHVHARTFTVVGILKPTGTPNDRGVFVNMEGFYLMEDHAKPIEHEKDSTVDETPEQQMQRDAASRQAAADLAKDRETELKQTLVPPLAMEQREVTAMLVKTVSPLVTPGFQNVINEGHVGQSVSATSQGDLQSVRTDCQSDQDAAARVNGDDLRRFGDQHSGQHLQFDERAET